MEISSPNTFSIRSFVSSTETSARFLRISSAKLSPYQNKFNWTKKNKYLLDCQIIHLTAHLDSFRVLLVCLSLKLPSSKLNLKLLFKIKDRLGINKQAIKKSMLPSSNSSFNSAIYLMANELCQGNYAWIFGSWTFSTTACSRLHKWQAYKNHWYSLKRRKSWIKRYFYMHI